MQGGLAAPEPDVDAFPWRQDCLSAQIRLNGASEDVNEPSPSSHAIKRHHQQKDLIPGVLRKHTPRP